MIVRSGDVLAMLCAAGARNSRNPTSNGLLICKIRMTC